MGQRYFLNKYVLVLSAHLLVFLSISYNEGRSEFPNTTTLGSLSPIPFTDLSNMKTRQYDIISYATSKPHSKVQSWR